MLTEKELKEMCIEICGQVGHDFTIPVKINKRLTRTLGRVKAISVGGYVSSQLMEISYLFLETASISSIKEVLAHECSHYLVNEITHVHHGHDAIFKAMCERLGCTSDKTVNDGVERTVSDDKIYKYFIICEKCAEVVGKYHRAGKVIQHPEDYTCKCGGSLVVIQNWQYY